MRTSVAIVLSLLFAMNAFGEVKMIRIPLNRQNFECEDPYQEGLFASMSLKIPGVLDAYTKNKYKYIGLEESGSGATMRFCAVHGKPLVDEANANHGFVVAAIKVVPTQLRECRQVSGGTYGGKWQCWDYPGEKVFIKFRTGLIMTAEGKLRTK